MAPPLMEELEEEILLRFPPHEPALLIRAALVCKRWRRLVSGPHFRRRFRELHRTPPMLGFLCNGAGDNAARFVPTTAAFFAPGADFRRCRVLDARHGRVLLRRSRGSESVLVVWDPITDAQLELELPDPQRQMFSWTAAVLCAACGRCDHLDCHSGPFLVVLLGTGPWELGSREPFIRTYSSDAGTWSKPIAVEKPYGFVIRMPSVLVENALYFSFVLKKVLLKYDLESREISTIGVPAATRSWLHLALDDGLGYATLHRTKLSVWRKAGPQVHAGWTLNRVIELETLLPSDAFLTSLHVLVSLEGTGVVFVRAKNVLFTVDLNTCEVKKVFEGRSVVYAIVPYMSFYTPEKGAACTVEGPSAGGSIA